MKNLFNFSAGPAKISNRVLKIAQNEFLNYKGTGSSFMELSHRDPFGPVQETILENESLFRNLLKIKENYKIFFMHGGAHAQFAAIPMNLKRIQNSITKGMGASFIITGFWSERAFKEQKNIIDKVGYDNANIIYNNDKKLPNWSSIISPYDTRFCNQDRSRYTYLCLNETISGLEFNTDPEMESDIPIIADGTSTLMSRPIDVSKYGMIFASSGKNLGPSGITTVICREDLIPKNNITYNGIPGILDWSLHSNSSPDQNIPVHSLYNTPPTFQLYMMNLVLKDLVEQGGLLWAREKASRLSGKIYDIIDNSKIYENNILESDRSRMNIPLRINKKGFSGIDLEKKFCSEASNNGLLQLQGHPKFGGLRITLYNGIEEEAVDTLVKFMIKFEKENV